MSQKSDFTDLNITTQSFMVYTNCLFDIEKFKNGLTTTETKNLKTSSDKTHGEFYHIVLKKKKKEFRNQVTVRVFVLDKIITVKVLKTGKFQMAGCKKQEHAFHAAVCILNKIQNLDALTFEEPNSRVELIFEPVMINVGFNLSFAVDQKALDSIVQKVCEENFYTDYETTTNTSVNLKMVYDEPEKKEFTKIKLSKKHDFTKPTNPEKVFKTETVDQCSKAKTREKRIHTFLVFASSKNNKSSKVIQSGRYYRSEMEPAYHKFLDFIKKHREQIEMKSGNGVFDLNSLQGI